MTNAVALVDGRSQTVRGTPRSLRLLGPASVPTDSAPLKGSSRSFFTPAKLEAFVAVAERGGFSAAARWLRISQPALSQTITALERRLGVELFVRSTTGVQSTDAGRALLHEARAILARYDGLMPAVARYKAEGAGAIRLGVPFDLPSEVTRALAKFATDYPDTSLEPRHLPMAEQLAALRSRQLDVSLMPELPTGPDFDTMLVAREELGVLVSEKLAIRVAGPNGVRLDSLTGLDWVAFPRANSPAWYDELAAILRTHGIDIGPADLGDHYSVPSVTFTALSCGNAFALGPRSAFPVPQAVVWSPLADHPVVRSTWAVWPASSRRRDVARLITAFEEPG